MRRWLPYPALFLFILGIWLLLRQSMSLGNILLGVAVAVALSAVFARLQAPGAKIRNHHLLGLLGLHVALDIVRSNVAVATIIVKGRSRGVTSGFIEVPLDLRDHYGLAILATIITSTPGTIWVNYDADSNLLLIHVLDLVDEQGWIHKIKYRYERLLLEVFE